MYFSPNHIDYYLKIIATNPRSIVKKEKKQSFYFNHLLFMKIEYFVFLIRNYLTSFISIGNSKAT